MSLAQTSHLLSTHGIRHVVVSGFDPDELEIPKPVFPKLSEWRQMGGSAPVCMRYVLHGVHGPNGGQAMFSIDYASGGDVWGGESAASALYTLRTQGIFNWFPRNSKLYTSATLYFDGVDFQHNSNSAKLYTAKQAYLALCTWYELKLQSWPGVPRSMNQAPAVLEKINDKADAEQRPFREVLKETAKLFGKERNRKLKLVKGPVKTFDYSEQDEKQFIRALNYMRTLPPGTPITWNRVIQAMYGVNREAGQNVRQREEINMVEAARLIKWLSDNVTFDVK